MRFFVSILLFLTAASTFALEGGFEQIGSTVFGALRVNPVNETLFGSGLSLSGDGLHLAVGAKGHDVAPDLDNGGVFLYDWDAISGDWVAGVSFLGSVGEGLGEVSISSDGSRVAILRLNTPGNHYVEVYDSTGAKLGASLFAGDIGGSVALSGDGSTVVVGSSNFGANVGRIETYKWNAATSGWDLTASIDGVANNNLFGWAGALSSDGLRMAVSAPLESQPGFSRNGNTKIFDWDAVSGSWVQAAEFWGHEDLARFGLSIDLSNDGTTLVVGAPTGASIARVYVYELQAGTWVAKGSVEEAGNQIGRSVAIDGDGNRIAIAWGNTGAIRLFEWDGATLSWAQVNQAVEGGKVALADSGIRVASASSSGLNSPGGFPTGFVRVLDQDFTPSATPSLAPTFAPSSTPSVAPSLSPSLTESSSPSTSPSIAPIVSTNPPSAAVPSSSPSAAVITTAPSKSPSLSPNPTDSFGSEMPTFVGVFDWILERTNATIIAFDDANADNEIQLSYNISHRNVLVQVFEDDCTTAVLPTLVNVTYKTGVVAPDTSKLDIFLDIQQDSIEGSDIWIEEGPNEGRINICVRTDLMLNNTSVHFHEQRIQISIGLSQGFTVSAIDLDREGPDLESEAVSANYNITSCQCDSNYDCIADPAPALVQGSDVYICIETLSPDTEIAIVEELDFEQGALTIAAVHNSTWNGLTECYFFGVKAVCRSQLQSAFFSSSSPQDVVATGFIALTFVNGGNRKLLTRSLQDEDQSGSASFQVTMSLAGGEQENGGGMSGRIAIGVLGGLVVAGIVGVALFAFLRKRRDEEDRNEEELITTDFVDSPAV